MEGSYKTKGSIEHGCLQNIAFKNIKNALGGRAEFIATGSAPIKREVLDFLKITIGVNICEGYGLTENTAGCSATVHDTNQSGHVGFLDKCCLLRLKDYPDLGYTSDETEDNKIDGMRVWRGEICLKGGSLFKKYLNNDSANSESFEDGWFRTGDVGTLWEDGRLQITDRIKNIFKLQQGE